MTRYGQEATIWSCPFAFSGSIITIPSSRRYTAPSLAASMHGAFWQCWQGMAM